MANAYGWDTGPLEEIEDFRRNESIAIPCDRGFMETLLGRQAPVITT